jgi:hypothetical protein
MVVIFMVSSNKALVFSDRLAGGFSVFGITCKPIGLISGQCLLSIPFSGRGRATAVDGGGFPVLNDSESFFPRVILR